MFNIALFSGSVPSWVVSRYGAFGPLPDLALDLTSNRMWERGVGSSDLSRLSVTRAISGTGHTSDYAVNSSGVWVPFGANTLRQTDLGATVEESRTNSIRNNTMQGAVAGTPGTLPTNWSIVTANGLTTNVIGTGTSLGLPYIDIQITGTPSGTQYNLACDGSLSTVNTSIYSLSGFEAVVGGSLSNITSIQNIGGGSGGSMVYSINTTASLVRNSSTWTSTGSSIQPQWRITTTIGQAINVTLRLAATQFELGSFVTTSILTTSAAVTRNADVASMALTGMGSAYSLLTDFTPAAPTAFGTDQHLVDMNDGTANNSVRVVRRASTGVGSLDLVSSGTSITGAPINTAAISQSSLHKLAGCAIAGSQCISLDGANAVTGTAASMPSVPTTLNVMSRGGGDRFGNSVMKTIGIWKTVANSSAWAKAITT